MIIDIVFNLLKFIIVVIGIFFLFKKFFLQSIRKEIKDKNDYSQSLKQERMSIFIHKEQIEKEIEIQQNRCKELLLKADIWKNKIDRKIILENENYYKQKEIINSKLKEQEIFYKLNKLKKNIYIELSNDIKKDLEQYFSNKNNQLNYNKKIINFLK